MKKNTESPKTICYSGIGSKKSWSHSSTEFAKAMDMYMHKYGCGGSCPTTEDGLIKHVGAMRVSKEKCDETKRTDSKNKKQAQAADDAVIAFKLCARELCSHVTAFQADQYTDINEKVQKSAEIMATCAAKKCFRESSNLFKTNNAINSKPVKSTQNVVKPKKVVKSKGKAVK
jgi:hypothetical protein